jgi:8-oxo-dGTP pyrophosphatase MutT (NUDIX family)
LTESAIARLTARLSERVAVDEIPGPETRFAAVAAVLRVIDGPELLLIKRAEFEHDPWSGHMALPGGRREARDATLQATAIRETHEELALHLSDAQILGRLDDIAPRSPALPPIIVRPFVAVVSPDVVLINSREVAATYWVPFAVLRAPESQIQHTISRSEGDARFPAYALHGQVVWGLTERIVRQLLALCDE